MLNVKFKLRKLGPDPASVGRVFLVCYFNREEFMFYTSLNAARHQWDDKKQEFRRNYDGWQKANMVLDNLKNIVKTYEKDCILAQKPLEADVLKRLLQGKKQQDTNQRPISKWYEMFIEAKQMEGLKPASIRAHKATMEHFLDFIKTKAKNLTLDTYPDETHQRFLAYLRSKRDYHPNYLGAIHKNLKVFFRFCTENGAKLAVNHARLKRIYIPPKREFLTQEELKKWIALDETAWNVWLESLSGGKDHIPEWQYIEKTRDAFFFQALTGLRHSDLFRLTEDHLLELEGGAKALRFVPQKTTSVKNRSTRQVTIGLIPPALAILEKYKGGLFLLPVSHLRHYNRFIQLAAHAAGFTEAVEVVEFIKGVPVSVQKPKYETITSHIARHTFGTISRVLGIDLSDLKDLMGHSDVRTTAIYDHMANEYKAIKQLKAWGDF
ncbi:hypothetical protein DR864_28075 [Runella rosea]|uniref:Site-specific recombinase XerD n=1 Tax=Runella rosea TaxID=2259595 RepID=A0A344TRQ1_9BACT|nr:tyrosine-type recombinase/integrase [Runella rosea]AXE16255.1 hypothetical protein DR864_00210 [Runella rosea]AXE21322.1 hypothetical protein DR864_28075 [Runella rosea]